MTSTFIRAALAAVLLAGGAAAVWLEGVTLNTCFYKFTQFSNGVLRQRDDACFEADNADVRGFRVPFLGSKYDKVQFHTNGNMAFGETCTTAYCWAEGCCDYNTRQLPFTPDNGGTVPDFVIAMGYVMDHDVDNPYGIDFMSIFSEADDMAPMVADLVSAGLADAGFAPGWAVLVTIIHARTVKQGSPDEEVNYQMALISDEIKTYAIFKYGVLTVPGPVTGTVESSCFYEARIGFYDHVNGSLYTYKGGEVSGGIGDLGTANPLLMMTESNCGVPGMVVFDVTDAEVRVPADGAMCSGSCDGAVLADHCARCTEATAAATGSCYYAGYCFEAGTMVADLGCSLACTCLGEGKWDKCKPMKKDTDERKVDCLACRNGGTNEAPCSDGNGNTIMFADGAYCSMSRCLASEVAKVCGEAGVPCSPADTEVKNLVGKVPMLKGKSGWINWCNLADPPTAN